MAERNEAIAWRLVFALAGAGGVLYAGLTISGWIHGWERPVALFMLAALGVAILRRGVTRPVLHGFVIGFLGGLVAVELQAAFLPIYFANNPEYALVEMPFGLSPRVATALLAPLPATVAGALTAGIVGVLGTLGLGRARSGPAGATGER